MMDYSDGSDGAAACSLSRLEFSPKLTAVRHQLESCRLTNVMNDISRQCVMDISSIFVLLALM